MIKLLNRALGLISVLILLASLNSCENLIDTDTPINQINATQVFESVSTADAALSNLYTEIQSYSFVSGDNSGAGALLGTYTDELYCFNETQNNDQDIYNNIQGPYNSRIASVWSSAYKEIYLANALIEGVTASSTIGQSDKDRIKGEALFLRSLVYFYLTEIFGEVPYTTTTNYVINQSIGKISTAELLINIEENLQTASVLLDDNYRNSERIYPNRSACKLLLATVLTSQNKWSQAELILTEIIQSPNYNWQPDLSKTFIKSSRHILWQLKPLKNGNATNEALLYNFTTTIPNTFSLSDNLVASFSPTDLRKQVWIKELTINQKKYYRPNKYKNTVNNSDEYSIVFRLEEAYLLLAESLVQQNRVQEALPYLNAVKLKAGITSITSILKDQVLTEILTEYRKEFFTEKGIRFLSLKRIGRLDDLKSEKPNWKEFHQYWPLPNNELILNPNLNPQNNGY